MVLQDERTAPLSAILSATVFPGRVFVKCDEVAKVVGCTPRHIHNLCMDGTIRGAVCVGGDMNQKKAAFWRIPVAVYDAWVKRKSNIPELNG